MGCKRDVISRLDGIYCGANFCRLFLALPLLLSVSGLKAQSSEVTVERVAFANAGVRLAGEIHAPQHAWAAVVQVHGSDPAPRMTALAALLAEKGISVLTFDKRGVGESQGTYVGPEVGTNNVDPANIALLAEDANAVVGVLHLRDKRLPVGLMGISQAGWVIPIAAAKNPLVDFMVFFSSSPVSTLEQLRFQFFTEGKSDFWDTHTEGQVREHIRTAADRYRFTDTDPSQTLDRLSIPGLCFVGLRDLQVPVGLSIERLNTLLAQGKPYHYCLFPTLGHQVVFSDHTEPIEIAVHWMKTLGLKNNKNLD